jgi:cytochrome c5
MDMHVSRITNASLFVTVLSACLGLAMTGIHAQAHAQQGIKTAVNESQALVTSVTAQHLSPQQARRFAATGNSYFQLAVCHAQGETAAPLYQNPKALTRKDRILVVTRLPRAALALGC